MAVLGLIVHSSWGGRTESFSFLPPGQAVLKLGQDPQGKLEVKLDKERLTGFAPDRLSCRPAWRLHSPHGACRNQLAWPASHKHTWLGPAQLRVSPQNVVAQLPARTRFLCDVAPSLVLLSILSRTRFPTWCSSVLVTGLLTRPPSLHPGPSLTSNRPAS